VGYRGSPKGTSMISPQTAGFNGAAVGYRGSRSPRMRAPAPACPRLNGAAVGYRGSPTRRGRSVGGSRASMGPRLVTAEVYRAVVGPYADGLASMGPRLVTAEVQPSAVKRAASAPSFNG